MAIQSRGNRGQHLVTRGAVPVQLVVEHIRTNKDIEAACKRFNLTPDDVFECIDFWADSNQPNSESYVVVENYGTASDIKIGAKSISDDLWFGLISYARMFYPNDLDLGILLQQGLRIVVLECYMDIYTGNRNYTHSDLHNTVFEAVVDAVGKPYDTQEALDFLGVDEYLEMHNGWDKEDFYTRSTQ